MLRTPPFLLAPSRLFILGIVVATGNLSRAQEESSTPVVKSVQVDGTELDSPEEHGAEIPHGARNVQIQFGVPSSKANSTRLRYKLEGFEPHWRELPSAFQMNFIFFDLKKNRVGLPNFLISGTSPGWNGSIEASEFTERTVESTVAEGINTFSVEWHSTQEPNFPDLGEYAIKDIRIQITGTDGTLREANFPIDSGSAREGPFGRPKAWGRGGNGLHFAHVIPLAGKEAGYALAIHDNHTHMHGVWFLDSQYHPKVSPGEKIRVSWKDCYSIGAGGQGKAEYHYLKPGKYNFQVQALTSAGIPIGAPSHMPLLVRPQFWREQWFWSVLALGGVTLGVWISKYRQEQRLVLAMAAVEQKRAFEQERVRIARDIHDDLGAGLAQIAMLSELIKTDDPATEDWRTHVERIFRKARESGRKLDEIVWAINPLHDSAEDLVAYIARFAQEYLELANVRLRLDVPQVLAAIPLKATERHHVFLAVKEAIHNAVKHGSPTEITLRIHLDPKQLSITVEDNGRGFVDKSPEQLTRGSVGMLNRLNDINGTFQRKSSPGLGTTVVFSIPIPPAL